MPMRSDTCKNFNYDTACWQCGKNKPGKTCIEHEKFSTFSAIVWTVVGLVPAAFVALIGRDKQLAIIKKQWASPSMTTLVVGIFLLFSAIYAIGHIIKTKRSHPHDYAVASFTAPLSIYAALSALFTALTDVP